MNALSTHKLVVLKKRQREADHSLGLKLAFAVLCIAVLVGCYGPLNAETSNSVVTMDLSGLIAALDVPDEETWVLDVYLFRSADVVDFYGDEGVDVSFTSREDSVLIDGKRFHRVVTGVQDHDSPDPQSGSYTANARVAGIPVGGPYVLAIEVWRPNYGYYDWWVSSSDAGDGSRVLFTFAIRSGENTKIDSTRLYYAYYVWFDDEPQ